MPRDDEWPWYHLSMERVRVPTRLITTPYLSHKFTREHSFNCFLKRGFIIDSPHKYSRFLETATFQGLGVDGGDGANTVTVIAQSRRQHNTPQIDQPEPTPTLRESFRIPDTPPRPSFWLCPLSSTESGCVSWSFPKIQNITFARLRTTGHVGGCTIPNSSGIPLALPSQEPSLFPLSSSLGFSPLTRRHFSLVGSLSL